MAVAEAGICPEGDIEVVIEVEAEDSPPIRCCVPGGQIE
jgi:hypothetical protein